MSRDERINIRLPPRVRIRIVDSATGSYPTLARTGDADRKGNYPSIFDDTSTVIFANNVQINLPSTLPQSQFIAGGMLLDVSSSLVTTGTVRKGLADKFVTRFAPGEDLKPYDDSARLWQQGVGGDPFYATGSTLEDVGEGFTSPLFSKTIIEIDMYPSTEYTAGIRNGGVTGSSVTSADSVPGNWIFDGQNNYPMMYYNFSQKKWEGIGRGIPTSITGTQGYLYGCNPQLSLEQNIRDQLYGFSPSYAITASLEGRQAAIPMSNFGFPLHPKFHATSSQLLDMSNFLTHPFVLEKIVYEFSASYRLGSAATVPNRDPTFSTNYPNYKNSFSGALGAVTTFTNQSSSVGNTSRANNLSFVSGAYGLPISTFFILNQRYPYATMMQTRQEQLQPHDDTYGGAASFASAGQPYPLPSRSLDILVPSSTQVSSGSAYTIVNTVRDIITFAQVVPFLTATTVDNQELLKRDLVITSCSIPTDPSQPLWSGSFVMSATVRTPVVNEQIAYMDAGINDTSNVVYTFNKPGGRNNAALPTGRDLVSSVLGYTISASFVVNDNGFTADSKPGLFNYKNDPYILYPTDKLVFGWQVPLGKRMFSEGRIQDLTGTIEGRASELTIKPGKGRLLLYGSLMRQAHEYHDTLNQPLTSPAIHEALHSDNPVLDQFDTEPRQMFSGTNLGEYVTGSMTLNQATRRHVLASTLSSGNVNNLFNDTNFDGAENRARLTAFNRFMQFSSENERFFDTLMPRYDKISVRDGSPIVTRFAGGVNPTHNIALLGTFMTSSGGTVYPSLAPNASWFRAFPFEPRYSDIPRDQDVVVNTEGTRKLATGIFGDPLRSPEFKKLTLAYTIIHSQSLSPTFPIVYLIDSEEAIASPREVMLHLFGIGDFSIGTVVDDGFRRVSGSVGNAVHWQSRSLNASSNDIIVGSIFRGFKYGVHNALPQYSKAVFRRNAFGQFRDLLEQRLDAKFFDVIGLNSDGSKSGRQGATSSPVQVKFVVPTSTRVTSPTKTFCSNLSIEATSSMPYFDGVVKNREEPLLLSNINSSIVTI